MEKMVGADRVSGRVVFGHTVANAMRVGAEPVAERI
jgi:hypothetical protein